MSTVSSLPRHLRDAVVKEFAGETILWVGRPSAMRTFLVATLIWLFAVPWTAFSFGWEFMALQGWISGKPAPSPTHLVMGFVFPLFGLPFIAVGFGMMAVPFLAWSSARRTVHVVGERRLVTMSVGRRLKVKSYPKDQNVRTKRSEKRDGTGTLHVVTGVRRDSDGDRHESTEVLYGIRDVRMVEQLVAPYAKAA